MRTRKVFENEMVWARFDDRYSESPKIEKAGPWAELLDMRAIIYSARNETDGLITRSALSRIGVGIPKPTTRAQTLVDVGRWTVNELGGGWLIHDFLVYNPSKAQLAKTREEGKERAKRSREAKTNPMRTFAAGSGDPHARARGPGISIEEQGAGNLDQSLDQASAPPWRDTGQDPMRWARKSGSS